MRETAESNRRAHSLALAAILIGQAVFVAVLASKLFFYAEDLPVLAKLLPAPLDSQTLLEPYFGHLMPGYVLVNWLFVHTVGASWPTAVTLMVIVALLGTVGVLRLCRKVSRRPRAWHLAVAGAYAFSIVVFCASTWFSAFIAITIPSTFLIYALTSFVDFANDRRFVPALLLFVYFSCGIAFAERLAVLPILLGLWVLLVYRPNSTLEGRAKELLRLWPAWLAMAPGFLWIVLNYLLRSDLKNSTPTSPPLELIGGTAIAFAKGFVPALFGIRVSGFETSSTVNLFWVLPLLLAIAAVVFVAVKSRYGRRTVIWFFAAFILTIGPVVYTRYELIGEATLLDLRYYSDALVYLCFAVALILDHWFPQRAVPQARRSIALPRLTLAGLASLVTIFTVVSAIQAGDLGRGSRAMAERFEQTYQSEVGSGKLPGLVAGYVDFPLTLPQYGYSTGKEILPLLVPNVQFTDSPENAAWMYFDGTVGPLVTEVKGTMSRPTCIKGGASARKIVSFPVQPDVAKLVFHAAYRTTSATEIELYAKSESERLPLIATGWPIRTVNHPKSLLIELPAGDTSAITIAVRGAGELCLDQASVSRAK